jgi:hypothetical protein
MVASSAPTAPVKTADASGTVPITTSAAKTVELKAHAVPVVAEPAGNVSAPEQATKSEPIADGPAAARSADQSDNAMTTDTQTAASATATDLIPMVEPAPVNFDGIRPIEPQAKPVMVERPTEPVPLPVRAPGWREAKRSSEPVSIFISRKEAKLYVRLKMEPLFDAPVAFERPDQPIGTHVFTAMAAKGDDGRMRWTAITIPSGFKRATDKPKADGRNRRPENSARPALEPPTEPLPSPRGVFDRIVMPPEVVERIAALFIPGSSIIVSDNRLSDETGEYTEFIVLTP